MLVPTMAFAWWLVSLPVREAAPVPTVRHAPTAAAFADEAPAPSDPSPALAEERSPEQESPLPVIDDSSGLPETRVLVRSVLTSEMVRTAQSFLDLPLGAEREVGLDGHRYVFVLELHYHPPGFVGAPTGWHKGVTIYELVGSR